MVNMRVTGLHPGTPEDFPSRNAYSKEADPGITVAINIFSAFLKYFQS